MFRMWCKMWKDNHMLRDLEIRNGDRDTRTHKVFRGLEDCCKQMDLGVPMWLDSTVSDFKRSSKCRFTQDNFIEEIPFDYLEIQILEEDDF